MGCGIEHSLSFWMAQETLLPKLLVETGSTACKAGVLEMSAE